MKWLLVAVIVLVLLVAAGAAVSRYWINPGVVRELRDEPDGERAKKVMVLTLPSGRTIPVNYLREGDTVYAGADFPWWREIRGAGGMGKVLIRGEELNGRMRAIEDNPQLRTEVFARLRPTAVPFWGVLVVIELDAAQG